MCSSKISDLPPVPHVLYSRISVIRLIFLQAPEFSRELARPKNYEKGHRNIYGISVVLELKVENCTILTFKVILYVKNQLNPFYFFIEEYKKGANFY